LPESIQELLQKYRDEEQEFLRNQALRCELVKQNKHADAEMVLERMNSSEDSLLLLWLKMTGKISIMSSILEGTPEARDAFSCPCLEVKGQKSDETEIINRLGERLLAHEPPKAQPDAAEHLLGNMGLISHIMSRIRVIVGLGAPDAGKSNAWNKIYGIQCPSGLDESGRTQRLKFYPHPYVGSSACPALIADAPGYGDSDPRNDASRMLLACASDTALQGLFVILVFIPSGRQLQGPVNDLVAFMRQRNIPFEFVTTKVDLRYEELMITRHEHAKKQNPEKKPVWTKEEREEVKKAVIEEIKAEDRRRRDGEEEVHYACLSGWAAEDFDAEEDAGPRFPWITKEDVESFFNLKSIDQLRDHFDNKLNQA